MKRRAFLLASGALLLRGSAIAAPVPASAGSPFAEVTPIGEDAKRCIAFIQFTCPHCRDLHALLARWGRSLPKGIGFEFVPVVTPDRGLVLAARAWYAVALAAPSRLDAFAERAYALVQDGHMSPDAGATWEQAARDVGLGGFSQSWSQVKVDRIQRAMEKLAGYRVQSTPSLAIAGRYVVTLDDTQGDSELFLRLASGLLSKAIASRSSSTS
ncbi:MAG: thiol:disulfide interchange protein DsbA/DsbL [Betaproteobacteria bacterium]|nr:thiol:disulfide interchange protein DsbA/DsbL [Betaproteobacteria bacterium]